MPKMPRRITALNWIASTHLKTSCFSKHYYCGEDNVPSLFSKTSQILLLLVSSSLLFLSLNKSSRKHSEGVDSIEKVWISPFGQRNIYTEDNYSEMLPLKFRTFPVRKHRFLWLIFSSYFFSSLSHGPKIMFPLQSDWNRNLGSLNWAHVIHIFAIPLPCMADVWVESWNEHNDFYLK